MIENGKNWPMKRSIYNAVKKERYIMKIYNV